MWKVGEWSSCDGAADANSTSATDGAADGASDAGNSTSSADAGECPVVQVRNVYCAQIVMKGVTGVADDSLCDAAGERPLAQRPCDDGGEDGEGEDEDGASDEGPRVGLACFRNLRNCCHV